MSNLPNIISLSRIVFTVAIVWAIINSSGDIALGLFVLVILSDLLDGILARRLQLETQFGMLLDHFADAFFVITVTGIYAIYGLLAWPLPIVIAWAFVQYVVGSRVLRGAGLRASQLGRWNGIAYFVIAGGAITLHRFANAEPALAVALNLLSWVLVATTLLSIHSRARHERS